jgi:hypothetical protein
VVVAATGLVLQVVQEAAQDKLVVLVLVLVDRVGELEVVEHSIQIQVYQGEVGEVVEYFRELVEVQVADQLITPVLVTGEVVGVHKEALALALHNRAVRLLP